jgi:hypothetical protein
MDRIPYLSTTIPSWTTGPDTLNDDDDFLDDAAFHEEYANRDKERQKDGERFNGDSKHVRFSPVDLVPRESLSSREVSSSVGRLVPA